MVDTQENRDNQLISLLPSLNERLLFAVPKSILSLQAIYQYPEMEMANI